MFARLAHSLPFLRDITSTFRALFFHSSSGKGLCVAAIIVEDWSIIEVLKIGQLCNDCLPVVSNLANAAVVLEVQHFEVWHINEDFVKDLGVINLIIL